LALSLATAGLSAAPAEAVINAAGSSPSRVAVAATDSASVRVNWTVERQNLDPPKPGTVSSARLRILIGGVEAANLPRPLSQFAQGNNPNETLQIREVMLVPRALIYRAVKEGHPLIVVRRFHDSVDDTFAEAEVEVTPSGEKSAALSVHRIELTFDDGKRSRVLDKDGELRVVAEINTSGVGLLSGVWETATGAAAKGPLTYRPLALVRQGATGSGRTVVTSPRLPTGLAGSAFVRFRLTDPEPAFATPFLQYYVATAPDSAPGLDILLTGPAAGSPLTAETDFAWQAVGEAEAYQLVLRAKEGDAMPAAEMLLQGGQTETRLEESALLRLPSGRSYLWQVIAFDANGAVIGSSSLREIHKP